MPAPPKAVGLVLLVLALTACGPLPRPFKPDPGWTPNPLTVPSAIVGVRVEPPAGIDAPFAGAVAGALGEILTRRGVAVVTTRRARHFLIRGDVTPAPRASPAAPGKSPAMLVRWTLLDPDGGEMGSHAHGIPALPEAPEERGADRARAVARAAAKGLLPILQGTEPAGGPLPASIADGLYVGPVETGPGENGPRAETLRRLMRAALRATALRLVDAEADARFVLSGSLRVDPPRDGRRRVRIAWTVRDAEGRDLGTARQERPVPDQVIARSWQRLASHAAAAAVEGIEAIIRRAETGPGRKDGSSS